MKILYVVTGMQKASGVTVFVVELTRELRAAGHTDEDGRMRMEE